MRLAALTSLALWAFSAAATAAPCAGFEDVNDADTTYCTAVTYIKAHGITVGCTDTSHYCPTQYVTRQQMALYLQRLGQWDVSNTVGGASATIGGGKSNTASGDYSTVSGGNGNTASDFSASVIGGISNAATNDSATVVGGLYGTASGGGSVVLGGGYNTASASYSVAMGYDAIADQPRCIVMSLWSNNAYATCGGHANTLHVAADHGMSVDFGSGLGNGNGTSYVHIGNQLPGKVIASSTGAYLSDVGIWKDNSNRDTKQNFRPIDTANVLAQVVAMPITQWEYKIAAGVPHIGPMAQDFYGTFGLGGDDKTIATIDEAGVALAAIQALAAQNAAQAGELAEVKAMLATLLAERKLR